MAESRGGSPRQRGTVADRSAECTFPLHAPSVRMARNVAKAFCRIWHANEAADAAELAVSELFGNAVKAAPGQEALLRMSWTPRRLRVEVCDACPDQPTVREAGLLDEGGRGLWLIKETAVRWGSYPLPYGKCVWAEFALPDAA